MVALAFGGVIEILIIAELCLYVLRPNHFGEYTEFFEKGNGNQKWYIFVFICRTIIAFIIGSLGEMSYGMYLALGFSIIWLVGQIFKRPYLSNIRPAINCTLVVWILGLYALSKIF